METLLAQQARLHTRFRLEPSGFGGFPTPDRARVLWAGVDGDLAALTELRKSVERVAVGAGFPPERRDFTPHMTLGRYRSTGDVPDVDMPLMDGFVVEKVCLVGSSSSGRGVVYDVLGRYGLRPGGEAVG